MALRSIFGLLQKQRAAVVILCAAVTLFLGFLASSARVDYSFEAFFPAWDPARPLFDEYKEFFPKEDTQFAAFFVVDGEPDLALFRDLENTARIFEDAGLQSVEWVGSADVAEQLLIEDELALSVVPLADADKADDATLQTVIARYGDDPLYNGVIWNSSKTVHVVHGFIDSSQSNDIGRREIEQQIETALMGLETSAERVVLTGLPVIRARALNMLSKDQAILFGGGLFISFMILFLIFRSVLQTFLCLASVIPGYLAAVAAMALFDKPITVMTSIMPTVVLVVLLSDTVHLALQYRLHLSRGMEKSKAISNAFSELAIPCLFTSLTTAAGFLSLVGTGIDVLVDLGLFTALSILCGYFFTMIVFPALLSFGPEAKHADSGLNAFPSASIIAAAQQVRKVRPLFVLGIFGVVSAASIYLCAGLNINTKMFDDVRDHHPLKQDVKFVEEQGFGLFTLNIYLRRDGSTELYDKRVLEWIDTIQDYAQAQPAVVKTVSMNDYLKQVRRAVLDGDASEYRLPDSTEEAAQLLLVAQLSKADYLEDVYLGADGRAQVVISVLDKGSAQLLPLIRDLEKTMSETSLPADVNATMTGTLKLAQTVFDKMVQSLATSLLIAAVAIMVLMALLFRSVRMGVLAILPNLFPLLLLGAVMRIGGFELKPTTILVFAVAFGIVVDDTIHFLARFRTLYAKGASVDEAILLSLNDSGRAIVMSSLVIGLGFGLLMLSGFEILYLIGLLTIVAIIGAIAADLFLLPAILRTALAGKGEHK